MHQEFLRLILGFSMLSLVQSQATCYWPDGSEASAYTPCRNNIGACCYNIDASHHDLCYDNGLCYSLYFGLLYRGACTDQTFNSASGCAAHCTEFNAGSSAEISTCAESADGYKMCCGVAQNVTECCASGGSFQWLNATFINSETQTNNGASSLSAITTTTTITAYMTETAISASTSGATLSGLPASPMPNCNHQSTALGAGLGVPLGLMTGLVLVLGICLLRRNRAIKYGDRNQGPGGDSRPTHQAPPSKPELEAIPGARVPTHQAPPSKPELEAIPGARVPVVSGLSELR